MRPDGDVIRPPALRPGDTIGVVAPSGAVDERRLREGIAVLESLGFTVRAPRRREPYRCFAAPDDERGADLIEALADPAVRAVWCARGGYGLNRLLPGIDVAELRRAPKLCIGFSDATALLHVLVGGAGVAALHGPMVASDLPRRREDGGLDHLLAIAAGDAGWRVAVPETLVAGEVVAPLLGGCLAVVASLVGTPWAQGFAGRIALFEDVAERPQRRIDRMLVQLRQSGALDGVRGVLFGTMVDCGEPDELRRTILDALGDVGVPIGFGAPIGHGEANLAVPFGVPVRLRVGLDGDARGGTLDGLGPAVS